MTTDIRRVRTLTLRGRKWRVRWLDKVFDPATEREIWGLCDHAASTISFSLTQPPSEVADTLLHEFLHALMPKVKERHIRNGATELLAALYRIGLCRKRSRHEARDSTRIATATHERDRRIAEGDRPALPPGGCRDDERLEVRLVDIGQLVATDQSDTV
jgi:hypothetical protein